MKRTQIYLPSDLRRQLTIEARKKNTTVSELIRERIQLKNPAALEKGNTQELLKNLVYLGESISWKGTPKDLSTKIDEVLYG